MIFTLLAPLRESLRPHFNLSKSRLETLSVLLIGMINGRTVNLSHIASQFPGPARHASNYRRLQRFFQFIRLDGDKVALLSRKEKPNGTNPNHPICFKIPQYTTLLH